jgi:hypothetical protein
MADGDNIILTKEKELQPRKAFPIGTELTIERIELMKINPPMGPTAKIFNYNLAGCNQTSINVSDMVQAEKDLYQAAKNKLKQLIDLLEARL